MQAVHFVQEEPETSVLGSRGTVDFIQAAAVDSAGESPSTGRCAHQPSPCAPWESSGAANALFARSSLLPSFQWVDFVQGSTPGGLYTGSAWVWALGPAVDFIQVVPFSVIHRIDGVRWTSCSSTIAAVDFVRFAESQRCTLYRPG